MSERERAERAMQEAAELRGIALEIAQLGTWEYDASSGALRGDARCDELFGQPHVDHTLKELLAVVHPLDRQRVTAAVSAALDPAGSGRYDMEHRVRLPNGTDRRVVVRGRAVWAGEGPARRIVKYVGMLMDVTGQRHAEAALQESERRFRRVVEHIRDAIMVDDADGHVVFANERFLDLFGFTVSDLGQVRLEDYVAPEYREVLRAQHQARVRGEAPPRSFEYVGLRRDGSRVWLEVDVVPITDDNGRVTHTQSAIRDITARKRAEQALMTQTELLSAIIDHIPVLLVIQEPDSNAIRFNRYFREILGWTEADACDGTFMERLFPDPGERQEVIDYMQSMQAGWRDLRPTAKDGGVVDISWANVRLSGGHAIGIGIDIRERKAGEEALAAANERLAEADRRKDEFIAILSHELRNPLAPIRYALPLLTREPLSEDGRRAAAVVGRQVDHLTRLVDDLLDVSRITSGRIELRRERVTLGSIIAAAAEAISPAVTSARHTLELSVADEPIWLDADAARLTQIVTNLLNNSAKYTPRGGRITVQAGLEAGRAVIRVRDTGIGIPASALRTVFDMFRQVDVQRHGGNGERRLASARSHTGLGIGLALAKRLVEMHGGNIEAHSAGVGHGAEFVVRLPVANAAAPAPVDVPKPAAARERTLKVLVVDDNADLVEMLSTIVAGMGHDVRKALDGRSAVSAAMSYRPDVVLLDIGLPIMSGIEVARELRRSGALPHVRLVALTGWGQNEDRKQTESAGFDHHLTKPADPETVERLLSELAAATA